MSRKQLKELANDLALAVDPQLEFDKVWLESTRNWVLEELRKDTHGGHQREWHEVKRSLFGLADTARIRVQDDLADGLLKMVAVMEKHRERGTGDWNDVLPIKSGNLAQHIQLLLNLSTPATSETHAAAYELLHRQASSGPTPDELLYQEIMRPKFSGDHWGKGHNEEVRHGWTDSEEDESSSSEEEIITPHSKKGVPGLDGADLQRIALREESERRLHDSRKTLQALERQAYWKHPRVLQRPSVDELSGWRAISTDIAALALAASMEKQQDHTVISSVQLQREMLFSLSGRSGLFFDFIDDQCERCKGHPSISHLSSQALEGLLDDVDQRSAQLARLRSFAKSSHQSKTSQAFAESCCAILRDVGLWIGQTEQTLALVVPSTSESMTATPLHLLRSFDTAHGQLLDLLESFLELGDRPVLLLDALAQSLDQVPPDVAEKLRTVWLRSAEPMWTMLRDWLMRGMPVPGFLLDSDSASEEEAPLPVEYFIQRDGDVEWGDEDFWESAYIEGEEGWPIWLENGELRDTIVEAGKARGLLVALGEKPSLSFEWKRLEAIVPRLEVSASPRHERILETISNAISAHISPICALAAFQLRRVLDEDCGLLQHLDAIEGLLFMRHFPVIADWTSWLFDKIGSGSRWTDFHLLTGNLRDCIENDRAEWLNASAVRITTARPSRGETPDLSAVRASYQVPFPLSQIFSPTSMQLRSEVFTFLLRLLYARRQLTGGFQNIPRINACDASMDERASQALRGRLSWFLETFWSWIMNIIEVQIAGYRTRLSATTSLKAMIAIELEHARAIRDFCFLHDHMSDPRDAVNAILAAALRYSAAEEPRDFQTLLDENSGLARNVLELREEAEELSGAGEPGSKGVEVRQIWSMLAVALQDWR